VARLFGTDGVRGVANRDVTAELALDLSVAAAHVLADTGAFAGHRPLAVVGRDPRASGEFLTAAVVAGLASAGVDVLDVGVLPTPGVAFLTAAREADLGVMLSASHNAMPDNGIKFFARGGHKLDDAIEDAIERRIGEAWQRPTGADVGRVRRDTAAVDDYVAHLLAALPHRLNGLRLSSTARTAPPARCTRWCCGRPGPRSTSSAPSRTASTSTTGTGRRTWSGCSRPWWLPGPTQAWRSTVTPTGAWPWTPPARSWTATRSWPCWR